MELPPGSIHHTKINWGLNEHIVHTAVNPKAQEARQAIEKEKAQDKVSQRWSNSVWIPPGKHSHTTSDRTLSNTLLPTGLEARDLRRSHSVCLSNAGRSRKGAPAEPEAARSRGWDISTYFTSREVADRSRELLSSKLGVTRTRADELILASGRVHPSLVQQQEAFNERIRQQKESRKLADEALVQKYGPEGAAAMQEILAMPTRSGPGGRRRAPPPSRRDIDAVRQLPDRPAGVHLGEHSSFASSSEEVSEDEGGADGEVGGEEGPGGSQGLL